MLFLVQVTKASASGEDVMELHKPPPFQSPPRVAMELHASSSQATPDASIRPWLRLRHGPGAFIFRGNKEDVVFGIHFIA